MNSIDKRRVAIAGVEFLGTFALASVVLNSGRLGISFFPAIIAGLTLAAMVLVIGPISGAHINPAVTLGLWTLRKVSTKRALTFVAVQMLAGWAALVTNEYFLNYAMPGLAQDGWEWRIVLAEALGTLFFTFGIAAAIFYKYEGGRLAATIGASLTVGILVATLASNGALNPAVALGINSWNLGYLVAPIVGGALGMNLFALLAPAVTGASKKR